MPLSRAIMLDCISNADRTEIFGSNRSLGIVVSADISEPNGLTGSFVGSTSRVLASPFPNTTSIIVSCGFTTLPNIVLLAKELIVEMPSGTYFLLHISLIFVDSAEKFSTDVIGLSLVVMPILANDEMEDITPSSSYCTSLSFLSSLI